MSAAGPAVLLLTSPLAPPAVRRALQDALTSVGPVIAPAWGLAPTGEPDLLAAPTASVLALLAADQPLVACGVGSGAVLALRVAAAAPRRVHGLVLATGRRPSGPRLVRSVHRGVADLLPIPALQRLHAPDRMVLQTLDLVRLQDVRGVAEQVQQPTLVAWGRRDPWDRLPAARLARALPAGQVVALDDAGPGWVTTAPQRLAGVVAGLASRR